MADNACCLPFLFSAKLTVYFFGYVCLYTSSKSLALYVQYCSGRTIYPISSRVRAESDCSFPLYRTLLFSVTVASMVSSWVKMSLALALFFFVVAFIFIH